MPYLFFDHYFLNNINLQKSSTRLAMSGREGGVVDGAGFGGGLLV